MTNRMWLGSLLGSIIVVVGALGANNPTTAPAAPTTAPADPTASLYLQTFTLIDGMSDPDRGRIGLCGTDGCWVVTTPLDESTSKMLTEQRETIALIRRAAAMNPPRWEINGDATKMVELANHAPMLSSVLVLQARQELKEGKSQQAVDDLISALTVSRHISTEPTLMNKLVESVAWRPVGAEMAEQLPALPKELLAMIPARLATLPKSPTTADVIRGEYAFARMTAKQQNFTAVALVAGMRDFYKSLLDGAERTPDEFEKLLDEKAKQYGNNLMVPIVAPALKQLRRNVAQLETRHAMLLNAIEIVQKGESALDHRFTMTRRGNGFVLSSTLVTRDNQPLTLEVGR